MPCALQHTAGDPRTRTRGVTAHIFLDGADGVNPGASNANAEGGFPSAK